LAQARALLRDKLAQKTKRGNAMTLSNLQAADIASLIHPFTNLTALGQTGPNIMARGKGVFVYDSDGKEYLEAMSSLWCVALGWGEEELVEAATEQMRRQEPRSRHCAGRKTERDRALSRGQGLLCQFRVRGQ
jgi:4-aminobutyrate aminotransferase-like enzyme